MNVTDQQYLVDNTTPDEYLLIETPPQEEHSNNTLLNNIHINTMGEYLNLDKIMVSSIQEGKHKGVKLNHITMIWRIDHDIVKETIDINTQRSVRLDNPKLSRIYGSNDRMFRYNILTSTSIWIHCLQQTNSRRPSVVTHVLIYLWRTMVCLCHTYGQRV